MRPHGGHAVRRAGAAMVLAGPQQVPHSHTSDLWGLRLLSVPLYRGGERDPKRRSACPQQGLAEWGQTQTQSGPAPTPPAAGRGDRHRGVCPRIRATGLAETKQPVRRRKKHDLKTLTGSCQSQLPKPEHRKRICFGLGLRGRLTRHQKILQN